MHELSSQKPGRLNSITIELTIQVALALLFIITFSFARDHIDFQWSRVAFILNRLLAGLFINYVLLPRFYNQRKHWQFAIFVILTIIAAVLVEELVLEKIFFPDTRGARFTNVFFNFVRMMPMIMLYVGFKFAWDAQAKNSELVSLRNAATESQLQFLKSQINPHFLFNSLNNLYSYALTNSEKTPKIILELSSLLRYMLYDCREEKVPLEKEIKYLDDFVKLQSLQIEDRGEISFTSQGDFTRKNIAPLILIVFIENCFKHSTSSQVDKIYIDMSVKMDGQNVTLKCVNSYTAEENTDSLTKGIGLNNVITRLDLLYPEKYKLVIRPEEDLYHATLTIDLS